MANINIAPRQAHLTTETEEESAPAVIVKNYARSEDLLVHRNVRVCALIYGRLGSLSLSL